MTSETAATLIALGLLAVAVALIIAGHGMIVALVVVVGLLLGNMLP